jgi:hypothetical protein
MRSRGARTHLQERQRKHVFSVEAGVRVDSHQRSNQLNQLLAVEHGRHVPARHTCLERGPRSSSPTQIAVPGRSKLRPRVALWRSVASSPASFANVCFILSTNFPTRVQPCASVCERVQACASVCERVRACANSTTDKMTFEYCTRAPTHVAGRDRQVPPSRAARTQKGSQWQMHGC